jgi:hypothetical protein
MSDAKKPTRELTFPSEFSAQKVKALQERSEFHQEMDVRYKIFLQEVGGSRVRYVNVRMERAHHDEEAVAFIILFVHAMREIARWVNATPSVRLRTTHVVQVDQRGQKIKERVFPWRTLLTENMEMFEQYEIADIPEVFDRWPIPT